MLKVQTRHLGNVTVFCLAGRFVNGETATLRQAVNSQSEAGTVVLDLSKVTTIDASGLGLLLDLRRQVESRGVRFRLMNATKFVNHIFQITRLNAVFEVIPRAELNPSIARTRPASMIEFASCA